MTRPRSTLVCASDTPYYHVIGRCVRRAFLCGDDRLTGKSFDHRREWILSRLKSLTEVFAIDVCAYALMSNHYHLVVRLDPERATAWSPQEVITRWTQLFSGPDFAQRYRDGGEVSELERTLLSNLITCWANRLTSLSWFMRCLNEFIARLANQEDQATGRFWEGRFKSQALLDDGALLTAMAYVELNPVRAGLADSLAGCDFTSVQQRLFEVAGKTNRPLKHDAKPTLLPFIGAQRPDSPDHLPFNLQDYLQLVDTAGRVVRHDKRGAIQATVPPLLATLGIEPSEWFKTVSQLQRRFQLFVGAPHRLREIAAQRKWRWVRGLQAGRRLYARANE